MDNPCSGDNNTMLFKNCVDFTMPDSALYPPYQRISRSHCVGRLFNYAFNTIGDVTNRISSNYEWLMRFADVRVTDWPMMRSPAPTILITIVYVFICCKGSRLLRPKGEQGRSCGIAPSILQSILVAYNTLLIVLNTYIMVLLWEPCTIYDIQCNPGI